MRTILKSLNLVFNSIPKPHASAHIKSIIDFFNIFNPSTWTGVSSAPFGFRATVFIITLATIGQNLAYLGPSLPCESIGPVVDPNILQLSPQEVVQQTPYLSELVATYEHVGSMFQHYETAERLGTPLDVNAPLATLPSFEGFIQQYPELASNIDQVSQYRVEYNQLIESGADLADRSFKLRLLLYLLQHTMQLIAPVGATFTFTDLFPNG